MTNLPPVTINNTKISPIVFDGVPVITLAMMDQVHERPDGTARRTFSAHKDKLIEGEDFYLVDFSKKDVLRTFGIKVPPRGLVVLTESGYLLLVKLFTDDLAWQVQRQLVNGYFKAVGKNNIHIGPETLLPSEQQTLSEIVHKRAEAYGQLQGKVLAQIWSRVHLKFRVARYSQLPRAKLSEAILYVTGMEIKTGKPKSLPPAKTYHYPRKLLEQPHFTTPEIPASLGISILGNTKEFVSPLFALLNELRADGHEVSAPWDEAVAMREAIQRADRAMEESIHGLWNARFAAASTAGNS